MATQYFAIVSWIGLTPKSGDFLKVDLSGKLSATHITKASAEAKTYERQLNSGKLCRDLKEGYLVTAEPFNTARSMNSFRRFETRQIVLTLNCSICSSELDANDTGICNRCNEVTRDEVTK